MMNLKMLEAITYQQSTNCRIQRMLSHRGRGDARRGWGLFDCGRHIQVNSSKCLTELLISWRGFSGSWGLVHLINLIIYICLEHNGRFAELGGVDSWVLEPRTRVVVSHRWGVSELFSTWVVLASYFALALSLVSLEDVLTVVADATVFTHKGSIK